MYNLILGKSSPFPIFEIGDSNNKHSEFSQIFHIHNSTKYKLFGIFNLSSITTIYFSIGHPIVDEQEEFHQSLLNH